MLTVRKARGRRPPCYYTTMQIEVVVEIPKGTRNKYETDEKGTIWLDRMLFTSTRYPEDYGFVPETLAEDGDPVDALLLLEEPTFPGCHVHARPIGVFLMRDEEGVDAKLLCVPSSDPRSDHLNDLVDIPEHELREIAHFFAIYKDLEPGKGTEPGGWADREKAEAIIEDGRHRFASRAKQP